MNTTTNRVDVLVALNTLGHYCRAAKAGLYFNSPDSMFFDGSAEGYWMRVARELGATEDEINVSMAISDGAFNRVNSR